VAAAPEAPAADNTGLEERLASPRRTGKPGLTFLSCGSVESLASECSQPESCTSSTLMRRAADWSIGSFCQEMGEEDATTERSKSASRCTHSHETFSIAEDSPQRRLAQHFSVSDLDSPSRQSVQHFSIADPELLPPSRAQQFQEVVQSLETAASAIRQVFGQGAGGAEFIACSRGGSAPVSPSMAGSISSATPAANGLWCYNSQAQTPAFDTSGLGGFTSISFSSQDAARQASVDELSRENAALRGALGDAVRRLSELEGEQEHFMSEGVFDLVNSLHRGPAAAEAAAGPSAPDSA